MINKQIIGLGMLVLVFVLIFLFAKFITGSWVIPLVIFVSVAILSVLVIVGVHLLIGTDKHLREYAR